MDERPLVFKEFPGLRGRVEWLPLGEYPTPVERLSGICEAEGFADFYVKRDDLSSPFYGGNKVRKLEFLLAEAKAHGHETLLTFGAVGSNHVVATVIHGGRLGMRTIAVLMPQHNAAYVRKNLLLDHAHGARFILTSSPAMEPIGFIEGMARGFDRESRKFPYVIPPGGSNVLGTIGYVDAALELKSQIEAGFLPEPDFIFVTYGSGSTAAGLILGARIAGLRAEVVTVRVVDKFMCNRYLLARHVNAASRHIAEHGDGRPIREVHPRDILFVDDFAGPTYAKFTREGMEAVARARECDGIQLEGTYTGKTFAAALDFMKRNGLEKRTALFWNTYNSADLGKTVEGIDYLDLPAGLHKYFEEPVQDDQFMSGVKPLA
ncbi:MAG: 1-aminocyclopropane-1-carboxylate deaminase/D-cysteine desulfhydrase [Candidatus Geothermincolia bacterium]